MSFFYDRDQNVTGTISSSFTFTPSYGMQVSFTSELADYGTIDNYIHTMPKGLNHLQMQILMPFENRKEEQARQIISFFEGLHGTGHFEYTDAAQIYKPIRLFVNSIDDSFNENDLHNINVALSTDQTSSLLNWNNAYITGSNIKGDWVANTSYSKYDVVRNVAGNSANLYDSFYYCTGDHAGVAAIGNGKWTRELDFQPTYSSQVAKETSIIKTELPYSFTKRTDFGLHSNTIKQFKLDYRGISDAEARCILHFLIGRQGYRKFQYKIPKIYNQNKYFFAPQWQHTFIYKNVNDISVTLIEDPLGTRRIY